MSISAIFTYDVPGDVRCLEPGLFFHFHPYFGCHGNQNIGMFGSKTAIFYTKINFCRFQLFLHIMYLRMRDAWDHRCFSIFTNILWLPWQPKNRHVWVTNTQISPQNQLFPISTILAYYVLGWYDAWNQCYIFQQLSPIVTLC